MGLWMMRVNCTFGTKEPHQGAFHRDMVGTYFDKHGKIAILYLNSNNGGTQFKDGEFIKSEANRCVVAPSSAEHAGVWATDSKCRFVLNLKLKIGKHKSRTGGLTKAGREKYNRETGSNLK